MSSEGVIKLDRSDPVRVHLDGSGQGSVIVGNVDISNILSNITIRSGVFAETYDGRQQYRTHEIELEMVPMLTTEVTIDEGVLSTIAQFHHE